ADLFIGPGKIGPRGTRPRTMYILMLVENKTGFAIGVEVMTVEDTLAAMYASVPQKLALLLIEHQFIPKQIIVRSDRLRRLLLPMAKWLNIRVADAIVLPAIDQVKSHLTQFLMSR